MNDILRIVFFLLWVNGIPPLVSLLAGNRYNLPVDGGLKWFDKRPLFGNHKTLRGVIAAAVLGTAFFPLLRVNWWIAGTAAVLAITGDLLSSFIKRRFWFYSGKEIFVLDQIFEALFPLFFLNRYLVLDKMQNSIILVLFIVFSYCSSRLWLHIVGRPLPKKYPRIVTSTVRFREWKTCHEPLARWHTLFNLTSFLSDQIFLTWFFKLTGLYAKGEKNALEILVEDITFTFSNLPKSFDGFRILFLVDLHLDGLEGLEQRITGIIQGIDVDLCLIGGDIRMKTYGESPTSINILKRLMQCVQSRHGIFGVLGNHDCIEMLPDLEDAGIVMLVNDSWPIEQNGARIWLMGVDDPHYYRLHDAEKAAQQATQDEFSIILSHSPEAFIEAEEVKADLYLCGHTHGGQVCLASGTPIITNCRAPRFTAVGEWQYKTMHGYTSRGVAPSSIPIRFNCPGEISLVTLKRMKG